MKTTEIINLAPVSIDAHDFKDKRLAEATAKIAKIYQNAAKYADEKNREIAGVLATVAEQKAYEKDGFKSVAEYANKTFGIARQNAYALANAGKVYNDKNAPEALKAFSPSKLAEVTGVEQETLSKAIEAGTISAETTQKDLREYAKKAKADSAEGNYNGEKPEILDAYTVRPCMTVIPETIAAELSSPRILEDWDKFFADQLAGLTSSDPDTVETVKLSKGFASLDAKKATVNRRLYFNRSYSIVVEFYKYTAKPAEPEKPALPATFTVEQLQEMLAAAIEAQNNQ